MGEAAKKFRVGCQSWGYDDWVTPLGVETVFYPPGTKKDEMLSLYARVFDTIEVDATLYGMPADSTLKNWYDDTPDDFIFSLKFPREVTHDLRLGGPSVRLANEFIEKAALLGDKLGIFLVQFPARFEATKENRRRLQRFLTGIPTGFRFVMEFRHESWFVDWTVDELAAAGVGLCLVEGRWVNREIMLKFASTPDIPFRYIRVMGERDLLRFDRLQRDRDDIIGRWCDSIKSIKANDIFIYADNYFEGFAPATANKFRSCFGLQQADAEAIRDQLTLF